MAQVGFGWLSQINGGALLTEGFVGEWPSLTEWYKSPLALETGGIVVRMGDNWFDLDKTIIQGVTWTPVFTPGTL